MSVRNRKHGVPSISKLKSYPFQLAIHYFASGWEHVEIESTDVPNIIN